MSVDSTIALISLADAKLFLKIADATTSEDTILEDLIDQVSAMANSFCGRQLLTKSFTEYYHGNGCAELLLRNFPIIAVSSLYISTDDRTFDTTSLVTIATNVLIDKKAGIVRLWNQESAFIKGNSNIKIVYTAGFAAASVPHDLQFAVRKWVARLYMDHDKRMHSIQSQTIGANTVTYQVKEIPDEVKGALSHYRRKSYAPDFSHED